MATTMFQGNIYDEDNEEDCKPPLNDDEVEKFLAAALPEYFDNGDTQQVISVLDEVNISGNYHQIPIVLISLAMQKKASHCELASILITDLFGSQRSDDIQRAFDFLLNLLDDLQRENQHAHEVLGNFIARAIADECISPKYVTDAKQTLESKKQLCDNININNNNNIIDGTSSLSTSETYALEALKHANSLITPKYGLIHLDKVWGLTNRTRPVKCLIKQMRSLIKEYLTSLDIKEAERNVTDLEIPHFMHDFIYESVLMVAMEDTKNSEELTAISRLLKALADINMISIDQVRTGFQRLFAESNAEIHMKAPHMAKKAFIILATLGQLMLMRNTTDHARDAALVLELALKNITPGEGKNLRVSLLSTISYAFCLAKDYEHAIGHMMEELDIETKMDDVTAQCRVLSNLGYTYYKMRKYDKSIDAHRKQVNLAMRSHLFHQASTALNAMGHVHVARCDLTSALTSHSRCLEILRQLNDNDFAQFKELLSIGHIHCMLGEFKAAEERYDEARVLMDSCGATKKGNQEKYQTGMVMLNFNLAYLALRKQSFQDARSYYTQVLQLAETIRSPKGDCYKMRACNGLGHTFRLFKDFSGARSWFERQFECAQKLEDRVGLSQALCNLAMIYQHFKENKKAEKFFEKNFKLVDKMGDPLLKAYAHSYLGSTSFISHKYAEAKEEYEHSLELFRELEYCSSEQKTIDLNMAAVQERIGQPFVVATSARTSGNDLTSLIIGTNSNAHSNHIHA